MLLCECGLGTTTSFFLVAVVISKWYLCWINSGPQVRIQEKQRKRMRLLKEKTQPKNSLTIQGKSHTPPRLSLLGMESPLSGADGLPFKSLHTCSFSDTLPPSGSVLGFLQQSLRCQIYKNISFNRVIQQQISLNWPRRKKLWAIRLSWFMHLPSCTLHVISNPMVIFGLRSSNTLLDSFLPIARL